MTFAHMDGAALLSVIELAQLLGKSPNALYHVLCLKPDELPKPVFRQHRYIRWRASDVRDWLESLEMQAWERRGAKTGGCRRGRPRKDAEAGSHRDIV